MSAKGGKVKSDLSEEDQRLFLDVSFGKVHRILTAIQKLSNVNVRNQEKQTLLIHTAQATNGHLCNHLVRNLLTKGSDVNAQDVYGRTALMYACADNENDDAVRNLIRQPSCDPNLKDIEGNTALMFAIAADSVPSVNILLKHRKICHRVDVNSTNCVGLTALDMAVALKSVDCCREILESMGDKVKHVEDEEALFALVGVRLKSSETSI